jgi:hypothetical protein
MGRGTGVVRVAAVLFLVLLPSTALAQQPSPWRDVSVTVGAKTWITTGGSSESFPALGIDPISELRWRGVDAVVAEVDVDVAWKLLVISVGLGGSRMEDQGVLNDDDFDLSGGQGRFSHTRSNLDHGAVFFFNSDLGLRILSWKPPSRGPLGSIDVFIGYQFWQEQYVGFGAIGFFCPDPHPPCTSQEPAIIQRNLRAITQEYYWHSIRIGARTTIPLPWGFGLRLRGLYIPWSSFRLDDTHHLRADLRNNLSVVSEANGGWGVQLDGGLSYAISKYFAIEAGYQYWKVKSGRGTTTFTGADGTTFDTGFNGATSERYGPQLMLLLRF